MIPADHRFRPLPGDPDVCRECRDARLAPQHFGDHTRPLVPVPGFTSPTVMSVGTREGRS